MSNVLSTNEMAKNKVPDLLKDTLAILWFLNFRILRILEFKKKILQTDKKLF